MVGGQGGPAWALAPSVCDGRCPDNQEMVQATWVNGRQGGQAGRLSCPPGWEAGAWGRPELVFRGSARCPLCSCLVSETFCKWAAGCLLPQVTNLWGSKGSGTFCRKEAPWACQGTRGRTTVLHVGPPAGPAVLSQSLRVSGTEEAVEGLRHGCLGGRRPPRPQNSRPQLREGAASNEPILPMIQMRPREVEG